MSLPYNLPGMTDLDGRGRIEPPMAGDEVSTLLGSLERQRATVAWKCFGVEGPDLTRSVGVSTITIGGLLKHLAVIEDHTFGYKLWAENINDHWPDADWDTDPDWEWHTASAHDADELFELWRAAVQRSRERVDRALAEAGLDFIGRTRYPDGRAASLRRLYIDMIEEYARHVGHVDLIRESIDGLVGEDPPA